MRMSLMFAAVTLLTGINLFFIPFQPVPALWGAILAVAFVLINVVADKLRLWSGIAWIIVAGIIITLMLKGKEPGDELRGLITVFAFLASAWYCVVQYRKEQANLSPDLTGTLHLAAALPLAFASLSFHTICSGATFGS
ncbi:Uncharacterised protein [Klebsiella pneumoniae]|nr:Uncharacterised protein [Klebsiella pneumoniae]